MRLPMKNGEVDYDEFSKMIDTFIENGFNYFDTAHGYVDGKSETALRECLTSRYPRDAYILTDNCLRITSQSRKKLLLFLKASLKLAGWNTLTST